MFDRNVHDNGIDEATILFAEFDATRSLGPGH
jgi:hypothetical protein